MAQARILIVDDQAAVREELAYALTYEGYETVEASDGEAALEAVEAAGKRPFHVVLLDIKMPHLDGMQVLVTLSKEHPDLPVIMVSGVGEESTVREALEAGAYDYVRKPFNLEYLETVVMTKILLGLEG